MSFNKAEKIYSALAALQNELEETLINNCQKVLKELMNNEKVALLNKIHRLVAEEWTSSLEQERSSLNIQEFRCDTCRQHFPIVKSEAESGMVFDNSAYVNEPQTNYFESDDTSNAMNQRTFVPPQNTMLGTDGMENGMEFLRPQSLIFDTLEQDLPYSGISCSQNSIATADTILSSYQNQTLEHSQSSSETQNIVSIPTTSVSTTTYPHNRNSKNRNCISVPRISTESKGINANSSSSTSLTSFENHKNVSKVTSERSYLKHRSQSRARGSRIGCSHCGIMVATTWTLKRHMRRIHKIDESNFRCSICSRPYTSQENLNRHLKHCRRAHSDNPPH